MLKPKRSRGDRIVLVGLTVMGATFVFTGQHSAWLRPNEAARVAGWTLSAAGLLAAMIGGLTLLRHRHVRLETSSGRIVLVHGFGRWRTAVWTPAEKAGVRLSVEGPGSSKRRKGHTFLTLFTEGEGGWAIPLAAAESRERLMPAYEALTAFLGGRGIDHTAAEVTLPDGLSVSVCTTTMAVREHETSISDATFRTLKLVFPSPDVAVLAPAVSGRLFCLLWLGLCLLPLAVMIPVVTDVEHLSWWAVLLVVPPGLTWMLLCASMGLGFWAALRESGVVFDRRAGTMTRPYGKAKRAADGAGILLQSVVAVQICSKTVVSGGGRWGARRLHTSYQLNLMLKDGADRRVHLMSHCYERGLTEDARRLSEFLHKPLLDHSG